MVIQEVTRPVNPLDQAIAALIQAPFEERLEPLRHALPPSLVQSLDALAGGRADALMLDALAGGLADIGLSAAAVAAYGIAAAACPPGELDLFCAEVMDRLASMESRLGLAWSAQADRRVARRLRGEIDPDEECPALESAGFHVVDAWNQPEPYARLLEEHGADQLRNDPLRDPFRAKGNFFAAADSPVPRQKQDFSFFVCAESGNPVLQVECDVDGRRHLGCRETAIRPVAIGGWGASPQAEDLAMRQVHLAAAWAGCHSLLFELGALEEASATQLAYLRRFSSGARSMAEAWVDLSREGEAISGDYRTNHRRGIRWGERNLEIHRRMATDVEALDAYFDLYRQAGRLAPLGRDTLIRQLEAGWLSLFLATWNGEEVSLLLTSHHGSTSYYSCGVSRPGLGVPLSHALMHRAILDAKAMGQSRFHFGDIYTESFGSDKMRSIAQFKIGFTGRVIPKLWFTLPTRPSP
ncbi:hypothetical protein CU669_09385 [Paramagnetospirillum kuznetsovii]|uniref:BioF2-like acetyltransferase domain-containing protein n=1 Tax=Paramagnetospirillum kuznetsovii TaxID=2053833 RepID=A0A364NZ22_9PROT|nr:GNAT family N-acetyltransferase [Paramagnetospirillum kuznetsovii]RAU22321.1 hypothetical protein CU669_09385 [Paramagnetospirillum kuznetsovii]